MCCRSRQLFRERGPTKRIDLATTAIAFDCIINTEQENPVVVFFIVKVIPVFKHPSVRRLWAVIVFDHAQQYLVIGYRTPFTSIIEIRVSIVALDQGPALQLREVLFVNDHPAFDYLHL